MKKLLRRLFPNTIERYQLNRYFWRQYNADGEYELLVLKDYVPKDKLALDVGGNIGVYAFHLSKLAAKVISFEPNPDYVARLNKLGLKGYTVEQVALSDQPGEAVLRIPRVGGGEDTGMASLDAAAVPDEVLSRTLDVPLRTLDSFGYKDVGFVKIDVEGHEEAVLRGALQMLSQNHPALLIEIEERHNAGGLDRIAALLAGLGYTGYFFLDGVRKPLSEFKADVHQTLAAAHNDAKHDRRTMNYINNFLFLPEARRKAAA